MTKALRLRPPAKINLTLQVGPRRPDGFHDVQSIMQTVDLCDRLTVESRRGPFELRVRAADAATADQTIPADDTNLAWRAARALWRAAGREGDPHGVRMTLEKRIPAAAGLGGGSSDAAASLAALNRIWRLDWPVARLAEVAAELGSDVPFFLTGGTALAQGRGERVLPLEDSKRFNVLIVKPGEGVSTADAYRWLDEDRASAVSRSAAEPKRGLVCDMGWASGPIALVNDLQAPVVRRRADVGAAIAACEAAGAATVLMSGSGSAVFAVLPGPAAIRAERRLRRAEWRVWRARSLTRAMTGRLMGLW